MAVLQAGSHHEHDVPPLHPGGLQVRPPEGLQGRYHLLTFHYTHQCARVTRSSCHAMLDACQTPCVQLQLSTYHCFVSSAMPEKPQAVLYGALQVMRVAICAVLWSERAMILSKSWCVLCSCAAREGCWTASVPSPAASLLSGHLDDQPHPAELLRHTAGMLPPVSLRHPHVACPQLNRACLIRACGPAVCDPYQRLV